MHTQNVNTAASESTKTWVETPEILWLSRKNDHLTALAKIEGDLMMYLAFKRMDAALSVDEFERQFFRSRDAAELVENVIIVGVMTSPVVYELVCAVEALALELEPAMWRDVIDYELPDLTACRSASESARLKFIANCG